VRLYGLKNCDSCKKALRALADSGQVVDFVDLRANPVSPDIVQGWLDAVGDEILVNRKSTTWRGLDPEQWALPALDVLVAYPTLIKRPVILADDAVFVGWTAAVKARFGCE